MESEPSGINHESNEAKRYEEVERVAHQARQAALDKLNAANGLTDYLLWHRAASIYFTPQSINWMWDYGGITSDELITEQDTGRFRETSAKNAVVLESLRSMVDTLPPQKGQVRIGLKRVRNRLGSYDYRVLANFFDGKRVTDPLDGLIKTETQRTGDESIFFEPQNACLIHACDDLYKSNRAGAGVFYIPDKSLYEAINDLQGDNVGANEYQLEKTEQGSVKQDAGNYLLVGLLGGYGNERSFVRISDFWNKQKKEAIKPGKTNP